MENIFFVNHTAAHKKNGLLKTGLDEISKILNETDEPLKSSLLSSYKDMFKYVDFDTFAKIKELYSNKDYQFIPQWNMYFKFHNIQAKCMKASKDPIRIIFKDIPCGISKRDEHLIIQETNGTIDLNNPTNKTLLRKPFYLNLMDIDYAGYYKLLKYLILTFYIPKPSLEGLGEILSGGWIFEFIENTLDDQTSGNVFKCDASKFSKTGQRAALETNLAYILYNRRLYSIGDCIKNKDEEGLKYLIEEIGMRPTLGQVKTIERIFDEDLYELVSYYFEKT